MQTKNQIVCCTAFHDLDGSCFAVVLQYNTLNEYLPQYDDLPKRLLRSAVIGFSASAISDTCSNSIRVVKTSKQTATTPITYPEVVKASHALLCVVM